MAKFKKRDVIQRLVVVPKAQKRPFWAREMKMLNSLMEEFPGEDFWAKVSFPKIYDSLAFLVSYYGKKLLKRKHNEYNYKVPSVPKIKLSSKSGEDKKITKKKQTVRDFFK